MSTRTTLILLLHLSLMGCSGDGTADSVAFAPGQLYSYETRPGEESSRLLILDVEEIAKHGTIVHIRVMGLKIPWQRARGGMHQVIDHMPFSEKSLRKSVRELVEEQVRVPDFQDGYSEWRSSFDAGTASVFTTSVAESVDFIQGTLEK